MPFHILNTSLIELIEKWDNVICCSSDGVNSCAGLKYELVGDSYLTGGELNAYLADIDRRAEALFLRIVKQMADAEGITETLKASNQMEWARRMNNVRNRATEILNNELIHISVSSWPPKGMNAATVGVA